MKHLYFIRHGLSEANVQGVATGSTDTPLTQKGREQADTAGRQAKQENLVFDIILSSPLSRAHDTAQAIATHVDYPHEDIMLHPKLVERHFGHMEERSIHEFGITPEQILEDPFAFDHVSEVERITDLQYRANQVLSYLHNLPHNTVLLVSHGSFGRALWRSVHNAPIQDFGHQFENAVLVKLI